MNFFYISIELCEILQATHKFQSHPPYLMIDDDGPE